MGREQSVTCTSRVFEQSVTCTSRVCEHRVTCNSRVREKNIDKFFVCVIPPLLPSQPQQKQIKLPFSVIFDDNNRVITKYGKNP